MRQLLNDYASVCQLLSERKLSLHYQPVVNFQTHSVYCLEALLNWQSLNDQGIRPKALIAAIEQNPELSTLLDTHVVKRAIQDLCELSRSCNYAGCISVNVSPLSLKDPTFIEQLRDLLKVSKELAPFQVNPARLVLEITERVWSDPQAMLSAIADLKVLGVRIAINDFITSYAAVGVLLNTNVSIVKVDRSVTERLLQHEKSRVFAQRFKELTDHLNKTVIVEGVENDEQATWLNDHGYELFQGDLFAAPADLSGMAQYLHRRSGSVRVTP